MGRIASRYLQMCGSLAMNDSNDWSLCLGLVVTELQNETAGFETAMSQCQKRAAACYILSHVRS